MRKHLKAKDIILIILILVVAAGAWLLHEVLKDTGSGVAVIRVDGVIEALILSRKTGRYPSTEGPTRFGSEMEVPR